MLQLISQEEKPLSELETKIAKAYRINESEENEQREIELRLNKIEGLKPLLPNRKYRQKWEDLEYGISARSLIERSDPLLADSLKLNSGYWEKMEKAEKSRFKYFDEIDKNMEELLTKKRFSNFQ